MKLGLKIFLGYFIIFALCFYYPIDWVKDTLRNRYLEGVEDPLVDQATILATLAGVAMEKGQFDPEELFTVFQRVYQQSVSAQIYELLKTDVDLRIYITDETGMVVFDSTERDAWGSDYAAWRDVHHTLNGEYGARTTVADPKDPTSSILYVAAPICVYNELAGVLTVAKPTTNIKYFLGQAKPRIIKAGGLAATAAIGLSFFMALWITRPIKRLTRYANDVRDGKRVALPKLGRTEIGEMGIAFDQMREALAGKQYVETYVQQLTHEIKSPLSAIRGAAELLKEKMPATRRQRFLNNVRNEAGRIQQMIDRLLALASLENQKMLQKKEPVSISALIKTVIESKRPLISKKRLVVDNKVEAKAVVSGDPFLLHQAIANLVQNAIDFSPVEGNIKLSTAEDAPYLTVVVENMGPAIPDYAEKKIFEKFFSLQRPDSGKKSTGLGLNFVKEVAELHNGDIQMINIKRAGVEKGGTGSSGVRAILRLP